jgi:pyruvate decarboxylase
MLHVRVCTRLGCAPCSFLAKRIADLGVRHWFGVPGDFNLALLDELLLESRMNMVATCNELNAG